MHILVRQVSVTLLSSMNAMTESGIISEHIINSCGLTPGSQHSLSLCPSDIGRLAVLHPLQSTFFPWYTDVALCLAFSPALRVVLTRPFSSTRSCTPRLATSTSPL